MKESNCALAVKSCFLNGKALPYPPAAPAAPAAWKQNFPENRIPVCCVLIIWETEEVRLKYMRMSAYDHIYALLHKKQPIASHIRLAWSRLLYPSVQQNKAVTDGFGFLDHSGDLVLYQRYRSCIHSLPCTWVVGAICIIKKSNPDPVYFFDLDDVCVLLGGVDTQHRNCGIFGTPEIQSGFQIIVSIII